MARSIRDDHDLLTACAEGDEEALGSLYDRFGTVAYRLALRVVRDAALAEDVVQEAFLTVWRQAASFDPSRGRASTWILMLVHRRAVDFVRNQARFNALPDQPRGRHLWPSSPRAPTTTSSFVRRAATFKQRWRRCRGPSAKSSTSPTGAA
jgi:RNA polymerase sigma factor (sigma-70 family)